MSPYTYNSGNWLTSIPGTTYNYDNNGSLTSKSDGTTYNWDFENRLTQIVLPGTGGTVNFKYDPFGRRIQKAFTQGSTTTTNYVYDGANTIEDVDANGAVLARYTQGLSIDEPLAELRGSTTSYYEADGRGSITSLSNSAGALANTYTYDSFGKLTASTGTIVNPFQYTARDYDSETGLRYYRARYYDQNTGRFLSEDPLRLAGGSPNYYPYAMNNPVLVSDPTGLCADTNQFVEHYFFGNGSPLDLGQMGLGGTFEGASSVVGAVASFESAILAQGASLAGSLCAGQKSGTQVAVFNSESQTITDVTNVPCLYSVGHSTFFERGISTLVADCCSHKFTIRLLERYHIKDEFANPVNLGFELPGGHPYPINYDFYRSRTINGTF